MLLIVPALTAKRTDPKTSEGKEVLNVIVGKDDKGLDIAKITAEKAGLEIFKENLEEFKNYLDENRPLKDFILSSQEKNEMKTQLNSLVVSLNNVLTENGHDPISTDWLYQEVFETEPDRSSIISIGLGYSYIPFYDYETFLGIMIRPIWLLFPPLFLGGGGYTANFNLNFIPPRLEFGDRLGFHIVRTSVFSGLYLNLGDLGYDRLFGGLILLIGRARVVM
jgi:hypothetical protein